MKITNTRIPTCPHCQKASLVTEDVSDWWTECLDDGREIVVELTIGICPDCGHRFEYKQHFSHDPVGFECVEAVSEDE